MLYGPLLNPEVWPLIPGVMLRSTLHFPLPDAEEFLTLLQAAGLPFLGKDA